jgi:hypothetical protein
VTLITACALNVEPTLMHALIWKQLSGEAWSFSVPGESLPRVLPTRRAAIREVRSTHPDGGHIRVGLTGTFDRPAVGDSRHVLTMHERSAVQFIARSRLIVAPGIDPISTLRTLSVRQSRTATR